MYSPRPNEPPMDARKYDPNANQWMREAMESRQTIAELKAGNDKLQREVYALNSRLSLIYECLGELNVVDRVGDLMQKKIRDFQLAQHARVNAPPQFVISPRQRKLSDPIKLDDGIICGSSAFHQTAAYWSSYEGQVARDTFNRKNMFETEEAQFREKLDIFGNARAPSPKGSGVTSGRRRDAIDSLLSSGGGTRHQPQQSSHSSAVKPYGSR